MLQSESHLPKLHLPGLRMTLMLLTPVARSDQYLIGHLSIEHGDQSLLLEVASSLTIVLPSYPSCSLSLFFPPFFAAPPPLFHL
jgi:hypothetical protein